MIGKALTGSTLQGDESASAVINSQGNAVAVAEVELGKVAVQVMLCTMLVDAFHAALEDRIESLVWMVFSPS